MCENQIVRVYKRFNCFELIIAKYKKRCLPSSVGNIRRCRRTIYRLLKEDVDIDTAPDIAAHLGVTIDRYNSVSNKFEDAYHFSLDGLICFGHTLHENKLYILGGRLRGANQKTVNNFFTTK